MKINKLFVLMLLMLFPVMGLQAKNVTLTKAQLMNKIKGAWAGQTIGCTYGGPTEFKYQDKMIADEVNIKWPDHYIKWWFDHSPGLYDDIYMDLTFVEVLEKEGLNAPVSSFANAFAHAPYPLWHANQSARYNLLVDGLQAPQSGYWKNNPHADDIDFQIEADFSGIMAPGMPNAAIHYGDQIGHIMNYGDGWYGGVFVGAMYALAYVSNDIPYIVNEALKAVPRQSTFYQCVADVIKGHKLYPNDWRKTWQMIQDKWGKNKRCPDGIYKTMNIDAKINSAYIAIGLLYGGGDFAKTIDIATRCGQDSDCNPSSAGGILGCMLGYDAIAEKWMKPLQEVEDLPFKYTDISLNKVYQMSFDQALKVIRLYGGKVKKNSVKIKVQQPKTVRLEQSFEGMKPVTRKGLRNKPLDKVGQIKFNGNGIVINGRLSADDKSYVGLTDVYIDGVKVKTMKLPAANHNRSNNLYWNFDLKDGDHVLTFKRLNPQDNVKTDCWSYIVYKNVK